MLNLKTARKIAGMTQAEMAQLLQLNIRTYQGYEGGRKPSRVTEMFIKEDIERKLGLNLDLLGVMEDDK